MLQEARTAPPIDEIVGRRYRLVSVVGRGGMGTIYRAEDRFSGTVALKRLHQSLEEIARDVTRTMGSGTTSNDIALSLATEFRALASLRHPNVISVLDYGFDERQRPYLTMELLEGARSLSDAAKGQWLEGRVRLLAQVLQALTYLHWRGVIHRDLKPANVLVVDDHVKVLDFGIALARDERRQQRIPSTAGTPGFLAPELFAGAEPSETSDLYSFGVMALELLASTSVTERSVRGVSAIEQPSLRRVVERLLAPSPSARYQRAEEVFAALQEASGLKLVSETAVTRESFLQAARLVGRRRERDRLEQALEDATQGRGGALLLGGESGVGKSRLMEYLRAQSLVRGLPVLRGQAVSDGGRAYQAWLGPVRWLPLLTRVGDAEASVLKPLVPDIEELLGRGIPDAPQTSSDASRERIFSTIEELFTRQEQPTVILLEDVHWESADSLALTARLAAKARTTKLLLVASYRDDERPELPQAVPDMEVLKIPRLNAQEIAELSALMLGGAEMKPNVLQLLERETEGNPFFLVEVVRALAEVAGRLDQVGRTELPEKIVGGGMRNVIRRRLDKVPDTSKDLLALAAILGRELNLPVLSAAVSGQELTRWLSECAAAAVLESSEGRWQFAHDKLREVLIEDLPHEQLPVLHRRAAEALEATYPEDTRPVNALANHWRQAGHARNEVHYAVRAGESALRTLGAVRDAIPFLERALELMISTPEAGGDLIQRGRVESMLAEAAFQTGELQRVDGFARSALAHLGMPPPSSTPGWVLAVLAQVGRQLFRRLVPVRLETLPERRTVRLEMARLLALLGDVYLYLEQPLPMMWSGLGVINVGEPAGPSGVLARGYSQGAVVAGFMQLRSVADAWCQRALAMLTGSEAPEDQAYVLTRAAVRFCFDARWQESDDASARAFRLIPAHCDFRLIDETYAFRTLLTSYTGRHAETLEVLDLMAATANQRGDRQSALWAPLQRATVLVRMGKAKEAAELLLKHVPAIQEQQIVVQELNGYGVLSLALLRAEDPEQALRFAFAATQTLTKVRVQSHIMYFGEFALAEALFELLQRIGPSENARREELLKAAQLVCRMLDGFARTFKFGGPGTRFCRAKLHWATGEREKAQRLWRDSIAAAQRLAMPFEEAKARLDLAKTLAAESPERQEHLARARELFVQLQCAWELNEVNAALGQGRGE
jgi:hypothetical protein